MCEPMANSVFLGLAYCAYTRSTDECLYDYWSFWVCYAPDFEEVWEAYWFGPVHPSVHLCVTLAHGQEPLEIGSRNLVCRMSMKIKKTRIFFLVHDICHCRVIALLIFLHYKPMEACEQNMTRTA